MISVLIAAHGHEETENQKSIDTNFVLTSPRDHLLLFSRTDYHRGKQGPDRGQLPCLCPATGRGRGLRQTVLRMDMRGGGATGSLHAGLR